MTSLFALLSALSVAILAVLTYRFSVSDICGWYLAGRNAAIGGVAEDSIGQPKVATFPTDDVAEKSDEQETAACQLSGNVPHCGCSYAAVESMNLNSMRSILSELVQTPFFRYFKTVRDSLNIALFVTDLLFFNLCRACLVVAKSPHAPDSPDSPDSSTLPGSHVRVPFLA